MLLTLRQIEIGSVCHIMIPAMQLQTHDEFSDYGPCIMSSTRLTISEVLERIEHCFID